MRSRILEFENPEADYDYRWIITRDYDWEREQIEAHTSGLQSWHIGYNYAGTEGPFNCKYYIKPKERFRLKDEDDNYYCEGLIGGYFEGFEPLDDFGTANWGATDIEYYRSESGEWEQL